MGATASSETRAVAVHVRGIVQGVGFRPFVFRLARAHALRGWVVNGEDGVRIHVEGEGLALRAFLDALSAEPPPAARITAIDVTPDEPAAVSGFEIRGSHSRRPPTTRISPDLPVCERCLAEMFDPWDRRHHYPYINCTNCGPRFSIVVALPYDRGRTTMARWPLCRSCAAEYANPDDRRFHAQPVACPACGPHYALEVEGTARAAGEEAVRQAARCLARGQILAVKGIGGYHLACDADNPAVVAALRERKYRKDKAFAVMARDAGVAGRTVLLTPEARALLLSPARPIVVAPALVDLAGVSPENRDLGVMLPYAPLHHLLFVLGAPARLVLTSGNRSSEPIAYEDEDARRRLADLADAILVGDRPIARRVDDSIVRAGSLGPMVLRRSRGLAPAAVATLPARGPMLAVGGDLKNAVTLVVDGQAYVSQFIGDLSHRESLRAFEETIRDLVAMYDVPLHELTVAHDAHPEYLSTAHAAGLEAKRVLAVQHHRAHVASVLAERGALDRRVLGVAFDGTGYGDDGTIWGGEFFVGTVRDGLDRVAHLHPAALPGGDAAARHPVQAAAGFLGALGDLPDLTAPPFSFPDRFRQARAVVRSGVRTFQTTSAGRLFDTAAALAGFTRPITFEGQAAMWFEHLARRAAADECELPVPALDGAALDWRPLLEAFVEARARGVSPASLARGFHRALGGGLAEAMQSLALRHSVDTVVFSGGVAQNLLLLEEIHGALSSGSLTLWLNRGVPPNDGGLSLGQAALAVSSPD